MQHWNSGRCAPVSGNSEFMGIRRIRQHIRYLGSRSVQYGAPCGQRTVRLPGIGLQQTTMDLWGEIVACDVMQQLAVVAPDHAEYRITQPCSTLNDRVAYWLGIRRRPTNDVQDSARRSLMFERFNSLALLQLRFIE